MIFDRLLKGHERRISNSQQLAAFLTRFGGGSSSGKTVTAESAMQVATVFSCIRILAESVGQLPIHLYEQREREKRPAIEHPLYWLLHLAPNKRQTSLEFFEFLVACLALRGNAYAFINRIKGVPRELLPLLPDSITPIETESGDIAYLHRLKSGKEETYTSDQVLHVPLFSFDGVCGISPITKARETIGLAMATEEHGGRLFSNGARPGGVLQNPGKMSDAAYERLKDSWAERHEGAGNAHRTAILEEGTTWASVGMSSEDAQFLETRKYQRSEICGIFRVPPHMVGDLERATFSNIEHQSLDFVVRALIPYLRRIELRIRTQLLTEAERPRFYAKFNQDALLRGDMAARATFYTQLEQAGALSPNEIREREDMNPREGGDVYLTPMNMAVNGKPIEAAPKPPADSE